jgi:hypothetical protein
MTGWTQEELQKIGSAEEIGLASRRADGTLRGYVTMWTVRAGDDIYVRSAYGPDNPWYRRAIASGEGRIEAGGVERDVDFAAADPSAQDSIDAAYHAKYDRHGARLVATVVGEHVHELTIRLVPKDGS